MSKRRRRSMIGLVFVGMAMLSLAPSARADVDLWPLFETNERGTTVLYPLFVKEREFMMIFPFYARTNESQDHHLFWPLVKVSQGRLDRVAPFWFSARRGEYMLFPLFQRNEEFTVTLIPPMYTAADGSLRAFLPFYTDSKIESKDETWTSMSVLWPIYSRSQHSKAQGEMMEQERSFLFFSDSSSSDGTRRMRLFGVPVSERIQ